MNKRKATILCFILILASALFCCKKSPTTPNADILELPVIWTNTDTFTFSASAENGNPGSQILKIKNSGKNTLDYNISTDAEWLRVYKNTGSSTPTIFSISSSNLAGPDGNRRTCFNNKLFRCFVKAH